MKQDEEIDIIIHSQTEKIPGLYEEMNSSPSKIIGM